MSEQAQVGDTVRLTIDVEGEVRLSGSLLAVKNYILDIPGHNVEILSRATPPLPSEPGTFWLDCEHDVWSVDGDGRLYCISFPNAIVDRCAPFRQLVLK